MSIFEREENSLFDDPSDFFEKNEDQDNTENDEGEKWESTEENENC